MPVDKLEFLTHSVTGPVAKLAQEEGTTAHNYERFVDLSKTELRLPAHFYFLGRHGQPIHKIVILNSAKRTFRRVRSMLTQICGDLKQVRLYRLDVALDLVGCSASELSQHCIVSSAQRTALYRSRTGFTFYARNADKHKLMLYDKVLEGGVRGVRIESQLSGASLPFRSFAEIGKYADYNFLPGVKFLRFRPLRDGLTPLQQFAARGMQSAVKCMGLQNAKKLVPAASWTHLRRKFFRRDRRLRHIRRRMRNEMRSWLDGRSPSLEK
jgi:hypothetical protein